MHRHQRGSPTETSSSVAFKAHRSQLRRHSEVFDNLFSIPQPKDQDLYDGWPWVEVYDCPSDVLYLVPAALSTMAYQREHAATDAFGHLACLLPAPPPRHRPRPHPRPDLAHLLPAALYDLSRYSPSKILSGTPAPPLSLTLPPSHPAYASHTRAAHKPTLPVPALLLTTFRGQAYLFPPSSPHDCTRAPAPLCVYLEDEPPARYMRREAFYFVMLNVLRSIACGRDADPLFTLLQAMEMLERTDFSDGTRVCGLRMCAACKVDFRECAGRAREEVWGLLPGWFWLSGEGEGRATQQREAKEEMPMDM
ncbi:hypothetical protein DFH08DRAFT_1082618 [Mycena albidolilacea]|uniref:BTB domain-containing protein n=1 Tax=Mycena albidolilacea TaxID=1033008 RepID=A0AAD7ENZ4_9AGAR|nr:hypothetical protein DFH08DRAFT_1082618 [Mycena albidolilacea]